MNCCCCGTDNVDLPMQWELKRLDCPGPERTRGQGGPAHRAPARGSLADVRGPPSTSPISAGGNGRRRHGRFCTSVAWTNGRTDMQVIVETNSTLCAIICQRGGYQL